MLELIITNPTNEDAFLKSIEFNYDDLKSGIAEAVKKYENLVITEDAIKDAKTDRANLNKFIAAMDDKRKQIKKQCLKAYEPFEEKIKELCSMVEAPCKAIDTQIKAFEDKEKSEKKKLLKEYFVNAPKDPEVDALVNFDNFMNKREQMLNKSYNLNNAYAEIEAWLTKINEHLCILRDFANKNNMPFEVLELFYKENDFDFAKTIEYHKKLSDEREKATSNIPENLQLKVSDCLPRRVEFWCEVTPAQAKLMQKFLKENNIKYGAIRR